jgi:hypothetical protein
MWIMKAAKDAGIYDDKKMRDRIEGKSTGKGSKKLKAPAEINDARIALNDLKYLMGARKYMRSPSVKVIFARQKRRIGIWFD